MQNAYNPKHNDKGMFPLLCAPNWNVELPAGRQLRWLENVTHFTCYKMHIILSLIIICIFT